MLPGTPRLLPRYRKHAQYRLSMPRYPAAFVEAGSSPKFSPTGEPCYMGKLIDKNQSPARQIFTFTRVQGNTYQISTLGPDGNPVYLTDKDRFAIAIPQGSGTPPYWQMFHRPGDNNSYIIRSMRGNDLCLPSLDTSPRPRVRTDASGLSLWQLNQVNP